MPSLVSRTPLAARDTDIYAVAQWMQTLPNPDPILRRLGSDQRVYAAIAYDPHVAGEMRSARAALLGYQSRIIPGGDRGAARRAADLCREVMAAPPSPGMTWPDIYWAVAQAVYRGYSVLEIVWQRDAAGRIVPAAVIDRPQHRFAFSAHDNSLRLLTRANPWFGEAVPDRRCIVARHAPSYDDPYGLALFSACFWPASFKRAGLRSLVELSKKFGLPRVTAKMSGSWDEAAAEDLADRLQSMLLDSVAVVSDQVEVDTDSTVARGGESPQERLVKICNREISKALTSQTLAGEMTDSQAGSRAAAETHRGREIAVERADREIVSGAITTLYRWITDLNFGVETPAPRHEFHGEPQARQDWANIFSTARAYLPISQAEAYERLGLTPPKTGEEVLAATPAAPMQFAAAPTDRREIAAALQTAIEAAADPDILRGMSERLVNPIIDADPETLRDRLGELYPDLNAGGIEDMLAKAQFAAHEWGRLTANG